MLLLLLLLPATSLIRHCYLVSSSNQLLLFFLYLPFILTISLAFAYPFLPLIFILFLFLNIVFSSLHAFPEINPTMMMLLTYLPSGFSLFLVVFALCSLFHFAWILLFSIWNRSDKVRLIDEQQNMVCFCWFHFLKSIVFYILMIYSMDMFWVELNWFKSGWTCIQKWRYSKSWGFRAWFGMYECLFVCCRY